MMNCQQYSTEENIMSSGEKYSANIRESVNLSGSLKKLAEVILNGLVSIFVIP
jgi:hypothetical protein